MNAKPILHEEEIREGIEKLVEEITKDSPSLKKTALIGVITRGVTLAHRMAAIIESQHSLQVNVGALDTRPHRDDLEVEVTENHTDIPFDIGEVDVILVDDVMSTGRTMRAAMDALLDYGRPGSIKTAVLIDRGHRELPITADYVGVEVPTSSRENIKVRLHEVDGGKDRAIISQ